MITWIRKNFHPLWHLRRYAWFRALQRKLDFSVRIQNGKIGQYVMLLRDFSYWAPHKGMEALTESVFLQVLEFHKPGIFLDVGANVGSYSWMTANCDSAVEVWLFEPDETNIKLLRKTITRNKSLSATLVPKAVAAKNGEIEFLVDDVSGATGSVHSDAGNPSSLHAHYEMRRFRTVECCCLDSFYDDLLGRRVVMKIDVEGAEDQALAGARVILERVRPVIVVECFEARKLALLTECGYRLYNLQEGFNWLAIPEEQTVEALKGIPGLRNLSVL